MTGQMGEPSGLIAKLEETGNMVYPIPVSYTHLDVYKRQLWNEKPFLGLYVIDYNLDEDPGKDHWQAPGMVHDWTSVCLLYTSWSCFG